MTIKENRLAYKIRSRSGDAVVATKLGVCSRYGVDGATGCRNWDCKNGLKGKVLDKTLRDPDNIFDWYCIIDFIGVHENEDH